MAVSSMKAANPGTGCASFSLFRFSGSRKFTVEYLHPHNLIPAVHVNDLAGDGRRAVAGEEDAGRAKLLGDHVALERRMLFVMFEHFVEAADAARGQRVDRAGADTVDA